MREPRPQGRNHLSGQCGKSAPFFDGRRRRPPLKRFFLSFCRTRRTIPEKLYTNNSIASQASPFWHVGAPMRPDNGRKKRPMAIRGIILCFTGALFSHAIRPCVLKRRPSFAWRRPYDLHTRPSVACGRPIGLSSPLFACRHPYGSQAPLWASYALLFRM